MPSEGTAFAAAKKWTHRPPVKSLGASSNGMHPEPLKREGDSAWVIRDLETAVTIDPGPILACYDLGRLYKETGRPEKAAATLAHCEQFGTKMRNEQEEIMRNELLGPE